MTTPTIDLALAVGVGVDAVDALLGSVGDIGEVVAGEVGEFALTDVPSGFVRAWELHPDQDGR
ncbi:hypothetical protein ACFXJ6_04995 [Streptomyces sp. NPDC059218]|uniref:hypothetical protein n=1 Tax=unclassified Streptomyces TaxID=2593676 RepID=UPI003694FD82